MEQITRTITKPRIKFISLYLVSLGIIWIIVSALSAPVPVTSSVSIAKEKKVPAPLQQVKEVSNKETEMAQELDVRASTIARLEKQLAATAQANSGAVASASGLQNQVAEQQKTIARLEQQLSVKTQTPANNNRTTARLESDNKYLSLALTSQARQTKSLTEEVRTLRAELENLRKR